MGFNSEFTGLNTYDAVTTCVGYGGIAPPFFFCIVWHHIAVASWHTRTALPPWMNLRYS